jgi:phosphoesterase RecJ-like protein
VTFGESDLDLLLRTAAGGTRILVSTHINPDPDAIGSVLAAREMLKAVGGDPVVILHDEVPIRCRTLPGAGHILRHSSGMTSESFHAAMIVDAGSLSRIGDVASLIAPGAFLCNVDHHLSNGRFGTVNFVDLECSATAELLYLLCREAGVPLTPSLASNLFAGLLTDTGRFRHANTTPRVFQIAAELAAAGADVTRITNSMYFDVPAVDVLSMGAIYSTLELFEDAKISTMFARLDHRVEDPDSVVDLALSIRGVQVAVLFSETPEGKIRVSLRSRFDLNVAAIAERFGGGGHEKAAGFRAVGTLESVRDRLLPVLQAALRQHAHESEREPKESARAHFGT